MIGRVSSARRMTEWMYRCHDSAMSAPEFSARKRVSLPLSHATMAFLSFMRRTKQSMNRASHLSAVGSR